MLYLTVYAMIRCCVSNRRIIFLDPRLKSQLDSASLVVRGALVLTPFSAATVFDNKEHCLPAPALRLLIDMIS